MLNEFIERVTVYEGEGRGSNRRVRVDIHLNFIGAFAVPNHIITPMEVEEQRLIQEEQAAKEQRLRESEQERYEQRKADKREFTARQKAGLLTPEEIEADEQDRARRREWQKEWQNAYFVIQGIGVPCSNIPGPKGVVSPVSGLVGWSI